MYGIGDPKAFNVLYRGVLAVDEEKLFGRGVLVGQQYLVLEARMGFESKTRGDIGSKRL
jgi:hypothetical protein